MPFADRKQFKNAKHTATTLPSLNSPVTLPIYITILFSLANVIVQSTLNFTRIIAIIIK